MLSYHLETVDEELLGGCANEIPLYILVFIYLTVFIFLFLGGGEGVKLFYLIETCPLLVQSECGVRATWPLFMRICRIRLYLHKYMLLPCLSP